MRDQQQSTSIDSLIIFGKPEREGYQDYPHPKLIRRDKLIALLNELPSDCWITPNGTTGQLTILTGEVTSNVMQWEECDFKQLGTINLAQGTIEK